MVAVTNGNASDVQQELDAGANPNALYGEGIVTPLIKASTSGSVDVVKILLNAGADVNLENMQGNTALHSAARFGHADIVSVLIESGADNSSENSLGWTPLMRASRYGQAECVQILINAGSNKGHQDKMGWTSLHHAVRYEHLTVVKLLLEKDANTEIESYEYKSTPMSLAAMSGSGVIIQTLIDAGANKDHRNAVSYTPLNLAAYLGNQEAIKLLVKNGADKKAVRFDGLNARQLLCLCTAASKVDPDCSFKACKNPQKMEKLLDLMD